MDNNINNNNIPKWYSLKILWSMFTYFVDVVFDIILVIKFFLDNEIKYGVLTLIFIFIPYAFITAISVQMYRNSNKCLDYERNEKHVYVASMLGPLWRYIKILKDMWTRYNISDYNRYMSETNVLRIVEGLLEAAPQLTLQLYILFNAHLNVDAYENTNTVILQYLSIFTSFCSIVWTMTSTINMRFVGVNQPYTIRISYFLWQISGLGSRILCISIMFSYTPKSTVTMLVIHWIVTILWMVKYPTLLNDEVMTLFYPIFPGYPGYLSEQKYRSFKIVLLGFICIFTLPPFESSFVNYDDLIYVKYYLLVMVETLIVVIILACISNDYWQNLLYLKPTIIYLIIVLLVVGLIFLYIYLKLLKSLKTDNAESVSRDDVSTTSEQHGMFENNIELQSRVKPNVRRCQSETNLLLNNKSNMRRCHSETNL